MAVSDELKGVWMRLWFGRGCGLDEVVVWTRLWFGRGCGLDEVVPRLYYFYRLSLFFYLAMIL